MAKKVTVNLTNSQWHQLHHQASALNVSNSTIIRALIATTNADIKLANQKKIYHNHLLLSQIYSILLDKRFSWRVGLVKLNQVNQALKILADGSSQPTKSIQNQLNIIRSNLTGLLIITKKEMIQLANLEKDQFYQQE